MTAPRAVARAAAAAAAADGADAAAARSSGCSDALQFGFSRVLGPRTPQGEVFEACGAGVVLHALDGGNGVVFAFGQTGSGKSYTICGGTAECVCGLGGAFVLCA